MNGKLILPPEFCYYAFNDKEPEQIPNNWRQVQKDRESKENFDTEYNAVGGLLDLLRDINSRQGSKEDILEKMHDVFSAALMQGYEKMEDLVERTGTVDRVEEIRNILIPFLPPSMKPFITDHHRKLISPSPHPRVADRRRQP